MPRPAPDRPRSLLPREHGAYAELALPLAVALLGGKPSLAGACAAASAVLVFLAHEPLLVLLGHRGTRALREDGPRARRLLLGLGGSGVALGGAALALRTDLLPAFAAPAAGALLTALLVKGKRERSLGGELLVAAALPAAALPVALASGIAVRQALGAWAIWAATFGASTWLVRSLIAGAPALLAPLLMLAACGALLASTPSLLPSLLPTALAVVALVALRPGTRHLRRVGLGLVAGSLVTAATMTFSIAG